MNFSNSEKGLRRIFNAMVTSLISIGVMIITIIGGFLGMASSLLSAGFSASNPDDLSRAISSLLESGGIFLIIIWASLVTLIVAIVLEIVGIVNCSKDDSSFKSALYTLIAIFVLGFIQGITSSLTPSLKHNSVFNLFFSLMHLALGLGLQIFMVKGIINLANKLQNKVMESKGKNLITLSIWTTSVEAAAKLMAMITSLGAVAGVVSFAGSIMVIVAFIMYFIFIKRGKEMLANAHD